LGDVVHHIISNIRQSIFSRHITRECRSVPEFPMVFLSINNQFSNLPILRHKRLNTMRTEITDIQKWLREYNNPTSQSEWTKAMRELEKVHNKYGTIDINIIKQLIS
jgi:hypothetical protein